MTDVEEILLKEMRAVRKDVKELRAEISSIKVKLASIIAPLSIVFGFIGAWFKGNVGK